MRTKKIRSVLSGLLVLVFPFGGYSWANSGPLIVDHTCTELSQISPQLINQAKRDLHIAYGHTSHGSQLIAGMDALVRAKGNVYAFKKNGTNGILDIHDRAFSDSRHDLGHKGDTTWAELTRRYLDNPKNAQCNVVIWSWCGGCSDNTTKGINKYLNTMDQLEREYPHVMFIYMTGHLDGTGKRGNLHIINEKIRRYCRNNNKILFDFADIESYDPDGNYFLDKAANDRCDYDTNGDGSRDGNWAKEWCNRHPRKCWYKGTCAHSQPLNCQTKGIAAWCLWAQLADLLGRTSTTE